jgi:formyl-CoA transferase
MQVLKAINRPVLKDDPRFLDNESRLENANKLDSIIQNWMGEHDRPEILRRFDEADATIAPVYDVEDITNDEHYRARNATATVDDDLGTARVQNVFHYSWRHRDASTTLGPT